MGHQVDELQRFSLKIFAEPAVPVAPRAFVPVFHRWIQTHAVDGLLIDVADYTHVVDGPSILLVAHEGNYALDQSDGRPGLQYSRKQPLDGPLDERLAAACRTLLKAARLLETEETLGARYTFRGDVIQFVANDRLLAPNTPETVSTLQPALDIFLARLFDGQSFETTTVGDARRRLTLDITVTESAPITTLFDRLR